jgi:sec-independent protein translocase protein TatC
MGDALCMPPPDVKMQATAFGTQFMTSITVAFMGGFIMAFPFIFWEIWRFIKPALTDKELKSARGAIFWVSLFFFMGVAFGYYILAPFTFSFLSNYTLGTQNLIETKPTLADYIENLTDIILGAGVAFQLPIISYVLTHIGLITPQFLKTYRKYALVAILVIAAIITPSPDWMSQMIVFIPLFILYEIGVIVSGRVYKRLQKRANEW